MQTPLAKGIDTGIRPDVRSRATVLTLIDVVEMGRVAILECADQFVLRAIEAALTGVGFDTNDLNFQFTVDALAGGDRLGNMSPVHAKEVNRARTRVRSS